MAIPIHNCKREFEQTTELLEKLQIKQKSFDLDGFILPYCEKHLFPDTPGKPLLIIFLHGAGSVGDDNFLQVRIPAEPLIRFLEENHIKSLLLMPQCAKGFQWVDVPWSSTSHTLPENPSKYMTAALALLDSKTAEYDPARRAVLGVSMGGYGAWDMACRRQIDLLGVVCGGADCSQAERFKNTRICIYHGENDVTVPVSRGRDMAEALKKAGCRNFRYKELPDTAHNAWDDFLFDGEALAYLFGG